jgi:hypothetical protein
MRGYLAAADDKDWFTLTTAADGRITFHVSAPAGVDIVLGAGDRKSPRVANRQGPGGEEEMTLDVAAGQPTLIVLSRAPGAKADPKEEMPAGLDEPYELRAELAPAKN